MATKNNIRSMRFSDTMIEMIEAQVGDTFTAKFEALVTRCMWELPAKEKELEQLECRIQIKRDEFKRLAETARAYEQTLGNMKWDMQRLTRAIEQAAKDT